jgi:DNA repair exonuclease SbcCD ATPase subunit
VGSEKRGLEQRLADRAAEVASLTQQLHQARLQFKHYQFSAAQQRADERHTAELQQRLLAQQTRLGKLQAQDHDHLQGALLTTPAALAQSQIAHEHVILQFTDLKQTVVVN